MHAASPCFDVNMQQIHDTVVYACNDCFDMDEGIYPGKTVPGKLIFDRPALCSAVPTPNNGHDTLEAFLQRCRSSIPDLQPIINADLRHANKCLEVSATPKKYPCPSLPEQ